MLPGCVQVAVLIANATSWEALVRERVLEPLGMADTHARVADAMHSPLDKSTPEPFRWGDDRVQDLLGPAGAIVSTAVDMGKWMNFLLNWGHAPVL